MKYMIQLAVIMVITFVSEALNRLIPLPIPASIYGMVILFASLQTGLLKLSQVKDVGKFLIDIMPLMFIPAAVGLLDTWDAVKSIWLQVVFTAIATTILVMGTSGRVTQSIIRREAKKKE